MDDPVLAVGGWVQCRATSRPCLRSTVSGRTIRNVVARRVRSMALLRRARIVRSVSVNLGRSIWRCNTRIWWRSARLSASRESPVANSQPIRARTRPASEGSRSTRRRRCRSRRRPETLGITGQTTSLRHQQAYEASETRSITGQIGSRHAQDCSASRLRQRDSASQIIWWLLDYDASERRTGQVLVGTKSRAICALCWSGR